MLPGHPYLKELQPLISLYKTDLDQRNIPLPSFVTAFPNSFGAIKTYYSCLPTATDFSIDDKADEELSSEKHVDSGKDSNTQSTIQQQSTKKSSDICKKDLQSSICQYCGKVLKSRRNLICHERIHTNEKPFLCDICDKAFRIKAQLKEHIRTHTGERPLVCCECGKTFRQRHALYFHKALHKDTFSHKCPVCFKTFPLKANLTSHLLSHATFRPYRCSCGVDYKRKYHLEEHLRRMADSTHKALPKTAQ